jgi:hypothetical protein
MDLATAKYLKEVLELPDDRRQNYLEALNNFIHYMEEINRILVGQAIVNRETASAVEEAPKARRRKLN